MSRASLVVCALAACSGGSDKKMPDASVGSDAPRDPIVEVEPDWIACAGRLGFPHVPPIETGVTPHAVAIADLDGDTRPDVAVLDGAENVAVFLQGTDHSFTKLADYATAANAHQLAVGLLDGDSVLDVAVVTDSSVSILLGNGDGSLKPKVDYALPTAGYTIALARIDAGTSLDLLVNSASGVYLLRGTGDGTFQASATITTTYALQIATGDFDGDTDIDVALAAYTDGVNVLISAGDGTFATPVPYNVGVNVGGVAAGDFTGDGKLDLVVGELSSGIGTPTVLVGSGTGTFSAGMAYSSIAGPVIATDLDGDTKLDLVGASAWSRGDGAGTLTLAGFLPNKVGSSAPTTIAVADLDGNGRKEIVAVTTDESRADILLLNAANDVALPLPVGSALLDGTLSGLAVGDFNGDTFLDVAMAAYYTNPSNEPGKLAVLIGSGPGPALAYHDTGYGTTSLIARDLNGDGLQDLAASHGPPGSVSPGITVLIAQSNGTFARTDVPTGFGNTAVAGDFDGDGVVDLVHLGADASVLHGHGDGTFSEGPTSVLEGATTAAVADFDRDGDLDLVYAALASGAARIAFNDGTGTFTPQAPFATVTERPAIAARDVNGDGYPDVELRQSNTVALFDGSAGMAAKGVITLYTPPSPNPIDSAPALQLADMNGDDKLDIVAPTVIGDSVAVLHGHGDFTFDAALRFPADVDTAVFVQAADVDHDKRPDLVVGGQFANSHVMINRCY